VFSLSGTGRGANTALKERSSFLKKRSKKLLLLRCHHLALGIVTLRGAKQIKVFWFFFSKKNGLA
jgi:hypothetical protein